jgi:hypothetical protein
MARADETQSCSNGLFFSPEQDREVRSYLLKNAGGKGPSFKERDRGKDPGGEPYQKRIENDAVGWNKSR